MTFEERKSAARKLLVSFLGDYIPPRGLSDDAMANKLNFIAEAFARRMPTKGDFHEQCERVFMRLRDTHESNTWPAQAAFVMAMPNEMTSGQRAPETFKADDVQALAQRLEDSEPVPESWLWRINLPHGIDRAKLEKYRAASVASWRQAYGDQALDLMVAKYGPQVEMFFPVEAAQ